MFDDGTRTDVKLPYSDGIHTRFLSFHVCTQNTQNNLFCQSIVFISNCCDTLLA